MNGGGAVQLYAVAATVTVAVLGWLSLRLVRRANARAANADADRTTAEAFGAWIENNRAAGERIGQLENLLSATRERMAVLEERQKVAEERERHQLARIAAHTVWDQAVLMRLRDLGGIHEIPDPPPLLPPSGADRVEN